MTSTSDILSVQDKVLKENFTKEVINYSTKGKLIENGVYEAYYTQEIPNKVLIKVGLPNGSFYYEGFNGSYSWEMTEIVGGEKKSPLKHSGEYPSPIKSFLDITKRGHSVEFVKVVNLDGEEFFEMKLVLTDGFTRLYYIDMKSYLIKRARDYRKLHPQPGEQVRNIEVLFDNFIEQEGVKIPRSVIERDFDTKEVLMELIWESVQINISTNNETFEKR